MRLYKTRGDRGRRSGRQYREERQKLYKTRDDKGSVTIQGGKAEAMENKGWQGVTRSDKWGRIGDNTERKDRVYT